MLPIYQLSHATYLRYLKHLIYIRYFEVVNIGIRYAKDVVKGRGNDHSPPAPPLYIIHGVASQCASPLLFLLSQKFISL